jgi:hypothetical protein
MPVCIINLIPRPILAPYVAQKKTLHHTCLNVADKERTSNQASRCSDSNETVAAWFGRQKQDTKH